MLIDEDSTDQEGVTLDNLSGKEFLADAEVRFADSNELLPESQRKQIFHCKYKHFHYKEMHNKACLAYNT